METLMDVVTTHPAAIRALGFVLCVIFAGLIVQFVHTVAQLVDVSHDLTRFDREKGRR